MENIYKEFRLKSGMESEWKRNGKGMENKVQIIWSQILVEWNGIGMEMEWAFHKKKVMKNGMEVEWKWNGNGMEYKWALPVEVKSVELEWKWNGFGMERLGKTIIL